MHTLSFRTVLRRGALVAAVALAGCNPMSGAKDATRALQRHHELYDTERFALMYSESDAAMKESVTEAQLVETAQRIRARLGTVTSTRQVGMNMSVTTGGGTQVQLVHETEFAKGNGTETFVFRVRGGEARLMMWNVNSPVFLETAADSATTDSAAADRQSE